MSQNLSGLAGDFASFYNLSTNEAFDKIRAGISGETEPLKQLGIDMSVTSLEAYALAQGIKVPFDKMSQGNKTILRYNYLMEKSRDAPGDFTRTQDSFANQTRLLQANFYQLAAELMSKTLPALAKVASMGNKFMQKLTKDPEKLQKIQDIIGNGIDKVISVLPKAVDLVAKFGAHLMWGFKMTGKVIGFVKDNLVWITPLLLGIVSAMTAWKTITVGMAVYKTVMTAIRAGTLAATVAQWGLNMAVLANPMTWIVIGIAAAIGVLVAGIYLLYKNWDKVQEFLVNTWGTVKTAFAISINWVVDKLNWLIEKMNKIPGVNISLIPKMETGALKNSISAAQSTGTLPSGMPKFAKGGFASRPSIFGDAGPEAAIPLKRTPRSLGILSRKAQALGVGSGGGSPQFVFAPQISGGNSREIVSVK